MPVGVLIDVGSVFLGGLLGGQLGSRLPEKLKKDLTLVFGVSSMAMGVTYLGKVSTLPAVILGDPGPYDRRDRPSRRRDPCRSGKNERRRFAASAEKAAPLWMRRACISS